MNLNLVRKDYMQAGVTSVGCMHLLAGYKSAESPAKVVLADHDGILQVFASKKAVLKPVFKTLPGPKINCVALGGPIGQRDRIFVASGAQVRGFSRKGKQFLDFNTNMTEHIQNMYVDGGDLFVSGRYVYNHYRDCRDVGHVICSDAINAVLCVPAAVAAAADPPTVVLACQDRVLRVLRGSEVAFVVEVSGVPSCLALCRTSGAQNGSGGVAYGTTDGQVALLTLESNKASLEWEIKNNNQDGGVTCLDSYDLTGDGGLDVAVGRDDGQVEIYGFDDLTEPVQRFSQNCSESVTSIRCGKFSSDTFQEVICCTYSGRVFSFTSEQNYKPTNEESSSAIEVSMQERIVTLRQEIEDLTSLVVKERQAYQNMANNTDTISAVALFDVKDHFVLNKDDASYTLTFQVQMPIDNVMLQSNVPLDLLEVEKNSAVVSRSTCDHQDGNFLLATYRCQANTTNLSIKIRSIEGQYGTLHAYVTPRLQPKTCQRRAYHVKALSLHQRCSQLDESRPYNRLRLDGGFSLAEMHTWLGFCLPEMPDKIPVGPSATFTFTSTFIGTMLQATYQKGQAEFRSDNLSSISILKDVLTKEATKKKIQLESSYDVAEDSVLHTLRLLQPKLEYQRKLSRKVKLIDGLKEMQVHEGTMSFLSEEYTRILQIADEIETEFKKQPCLLERYFGIITDLFIDKFKFKGVNVKPRVPQLVEILRNYQPQQLEEFFL